MAEKLIPLHGGYRKLKSFQVAELVYDVTVRFCDRYIDPRSRTHDQMVQAARSGVQNIAEGSQMWYCRCYKYVAPTELFLTAKPFCHSVKICAFVPWWFKRFHSRFPKAIQGY